jgi:hypothetical protein
METTHTDHPRGHICQGKSAKTAPRTPLEDLQIKPPLIFEDEPIITYPDTSDISALPVREEFLQLTAPGIGLKNEIEDPTPFPLSIKEDCCKVSRFGGSKGRFAVASKVFHDSKIICCRF